MYSKLDHSSSFFQCFSKLSELSSADMGASFAATLKYVGDEKVSSLSMWVIADLESDKGRRIAGQALEHLTNSHDSRVAFVYNHKNGRVGKKLSRRILSA